MVETRTSTFLTQSATIVRRNEVSLMWLATIQRVRATHRADAGFMLPMALFITMIAVAASTLVVGMVLFSIGQTQIGEARVQDNVTAEAGLDAALAALEQPFGSCNDQDAGGICPFAGRW